jgi:pyridoxamine 5'-phosphate oxidase
MDFDHPTSNPVDELRSWLADAEAGSGQANWNAMTLATVGADGRPSARVVLLKQLDEDGIVFFTNRNSRKARALDEHPRVALVLHWDAMQRQVQIEGPVTRAEDELSDRYFASRPRVSQLAAWASDQSQPIADRATLDATFAEYEQRFAGVDVPRPPHWGGYRVAIERIEFWIGREGRLHDRIDYTADDAGGWRVRRLCP